MKEQILKVLVGSRAHGTNIASSDTDYRGVHVNYTEDLLSLNHKYKNQSWIEGEKEDSTSYEIEYFLQLATKCHPNALEVLLGKSFNLEDTPVKEWNGDDINYAFGKELQELFPSIWNPEDAYTSFVNYCSNQRNKMLNNKDGKIGKFAYNYIRVLYNLESLLLNGTFSLEVKDPDLNSYLCRLKAGFVSLGEVINRGESITKRCTYLKITSKHKANPQKVHKFLMKIRKEYWRD